MADDHDRSEPKGIREGQHVSGEIASAIAGRGAIRISVAPLCNSEGVDGVGQVRQHRLKGAPGVGITVQKEHRNTRGVSLLNIGKLDPVRELNRFDGGRHV
jgi:hypothetical protein